MWLQCPKFSPRTVLKRHFKHYDPGSFSADIATVPFHVAHIFYDPEDVCWAWGKLLSDELDMHVPVKRSTSKRQHVPFITPELLGSMRHGNKLRKLYFNSKDPGDWEKYRLQRNLPSSLRRKFQSSYLRSRADSSKGDPKQFWHTINPSIHCKRRNNEGTYHLKENGVLVTDKKQVAEIFNHHFPRIQNVGGGHDSDPYVQVNVAVDISVHPSIATIRDECVLAAQFEFNYVSKAETQLILKSLDPNKATGHDQIPARVLRDGALVLAGPVARLINTVIDNAYVPAEWKLAEICPIFKRDDEFEKSKYRPVSIIVLLDKVFERCVQKQLVHYFNPYLSKFWSAYRKGYSCESVSLHLIEDWKGALDKNSVAGTVMDLSKA